MKVKPLITIYITNYNYEKYIEASIKSAINQTYKNLEIIVIDDCSSDSSVNIIKKFKKKYMMKTIFNKNRKGLIKSANIAMRASKGKFVLRLDADDILHPNAVKEMYTKVKKNTKSVLIFPDYLNINERSKITSIFKYKRKKNFSIQDPPAHGACSLIKKNFLKKFGFYNEKFDRQDGFYIWILIHLKNFNVIHCKKALFYYRKHKKNLSRNRYKILKTRLKILDYFILKQSKYKSKIFSIKKKTIMEINRLKH